MNKRFQQFFTHHQTRPTAFGLDNGRGKAEIVVSGLAHLGHILRICLQYLLLLCDSHAMQWLHCFVFLQQITFDLCVYDFALGFSEVDLHL